MLRNISGLYGYAIHTADGNIGPVHDFYFDDQHWSVRHLVVTTGRWLSRHRVLVPPMSVTNVDGKRRELHIALTKAQVANSPDIDTDKPVSRQQHAELYWHYGFTGSGLPEELRRGEGDPHLRRTREVIGYWVHGVDDRIGQVDDFLVDDGAWSIRYMVVDARSWWLGKKVLVPPGWIVSIKWEGMAVYVDLSRATVRNAPGYVPGRPVDRGYETRLYEYYGRPTYWGDGPPGHGAAPVGNGRRMR
jgi:uncharacterized protein YrrD